MSQFEEAVKAYYAATTGREIGRVEFVYRESYHYSTETGGEDAAFTVYVYDPRDRLIESHENESAGTFLTALFAFEGPAGSGTGTGEENDQ